MKSVLLPTISSISGNIITKYNSSRNEVARTTAVLLPTDKPSLCIKTTATAVPPTVDGEMAEVNSHNMITLNACIQLRSFSVRILIRIIYPRSLQSIQHQAINSQKADFHVTLKLLRISVFISLEITHTMMASPNIMGIMILVGLSLLTRL